MGAIAERARGDLMVKILNKCILSILVYNLFLRQTTQYLSSRNRNLNLSKIGLSDWAKKIGWTLYGHRHEKQKDTQWIGSWIKKYTFKGQQYHIHSNKHFSFTLFWITWASYCNEWLLFLVCMVNYNSMFVYILKSINQNFLSFSDIVFLCFYQGALNSWNPLQCGKNKNTVFILIKKVSSLNWYICRFT